MGPGNGKKKAAIKESSSRWVLNRIITSCLCKCVAFVLSVDAVCMCVSFCVFLFGFLHMERVKVPIVMLYSVYCLLVYRVYISAVRPKLQNVHVRENELKWSTFRLHFLGSVLF